MLALAASLGLGWLTTLGRPLLGENGPVEQSQLLLWVTSTAAAVLSAVLVRRPADRSALVVGAGFALLSAAREADAQVLLNPETIGAIGLRYRTDWWFDPGVSLMLKSSWIAAALALLALWVRPVRRARFHAVRGALMGSPTVWIVAAAVGLMLVGFTFDDLLRRRLDAAVRQPIEEIAELLAPALYLLGILRLYADAASGRRARFDRALSVARASR
jgi:hypothetical protein